VSVRRLLITTGAATVLLVAPATAASAEPGTGGCRDFGQSVSSLATTVFPKGQFGGNASSVATSRPRAFAEIVVHPEQDAAC
jgi:hypothetical protein